MSEPKKKISINEYASAIMKAFSEGLKNLPEKIKKKLSSESLRYGIVVLIIFLNIYNYKHNKQKHSKKKIFYISISSIYYILILLMIIVDGVFFFLLQKQMPPTKLGNYWWSIVIFLALMISSTIKESSELVEKDGTLNPPPIGIKRHSKRINLSVITLLVSLLGIYIEYINKKNNTLMILRGISTLLIIIHLYYTINFTACNYNLPETWRL